MRDYELVRCKTGTANLGFHYGKKWLKGAITDHDVTLLTCGESLRWYWMNDIEVSHIYVPQAMMARVAGDVFEQDLDNRQIDHCPIVTARPLSALMAAACRNTSTPTWPAHCRSRAWPCWSTSALRTLSGCLAKPSAFPLISASRHGASNAPNGY